MMLRAAAAAARVSAARCERPLAAQRCALQITRPPAAICWRRSSSTASPAAGGTADAAAPAAPTVWAPQTAPPPSNESALALVKRVVALSPKRGAAKDGKDGDASSSAAEKLTGVTLRRLVQLLRPEAVPVSVSVATLAVTTGISLLFPYAIGQILDVALAAPTDGGWSPGSISAGLLALFGVQSGLIVVRSALLTISGERMAAGLRKDAFRAILSQETSWFDAHRTGELLNRLSSDTAVVQKALTTNVTNGLRAAAMAVGGTGMLFALSPSLALLSLGLIPPVALGGVVYGRYLQGQQRAVQEALGEASAAAEEILGQVRTVRAFAAERAEARRFAAKVDGSYALARRIGVVAAYFDGAVHAAANVSLVAVLWYGGVLVSGGTMSAGDLTAFLLYSVYTGFNVSSVSSTYSELKRAAGAASRLFELTDRVPRMPLGDGGGASYWRPELDADDAAEARAGQSWAVRRRPRSAAAITGEGAGYLSPLPAASSDSSSGASSSSSSLVTLPEVRGDVTFRDIAFAYPSRPDQPVLEGCSLVVPAGKTVAVVGGSGSGKSTLAALLTRQYDPAGGAVLLDGVDIRGLDPSWLRGRVIGTVAQEPQLFACSVADNIRYGRPGATDDEVVAAAKLAHAHGFITAFPEGYATQVGERGLKLSGGQRQRVAIARAILKDPRILILDEATSALDAESEAAVMAALDAVSVNRTVITIAHRLSTMRRADVVAVLAGGRVVEVGSFAALSADPTSAFRALVSKQLGLGGGGSDGAAAAAAAVPDVIVDDEGSSGKRSVEGVPEDGDVGSPSPPTSSSAPPAA
jgi:ABC-type multidrug transport system fused ATPase/permease subunit